MKRRTPAYWSARLLLAAGIILCALALIGWYAWMQGELGPSARMGDPIIAFGMPRRTVFIALGCASAVVGLVQVIRIYRGPNDEPPPWRYRDR